MVFSSLNFLLIFLPIVLLLHSVLPFKYKNIVLLAASIIFYAWGEPVYVILMILSIGFNYMSGLVLGELEDPHMRKRQLIFAVAVNLLLLGFFKYAGFLVNMINAILPLKIEFRSLALPVGISFYTFQALIMLSMCTERKSSLRKICRTLLYISRCFLSSSPVQSLNIQISSFSFPTAEYPVPNSGRASSDYSLVFPKKSCLPTISVCFTKPFRLRAAEAS